MEAHGWTGERKQAVHLLHFPTQDRWVGGWVNARVLSPIRYLGAVFVALEVDVAEVWLAPYLGSLAGHGAEDG